MRGIFSNIGGTPGIGGISYVFPARNQSVQQLSDDSQLQSSAATLESFGFSNVHVGVDESPYQLADRSRECRAADLRRHARRDGFLASR